MSSLSIISNGVPRSVRDSREQPREAIPDDAVSKERTSSTDIENTTRPSEPEMPIQPPLPATNKRSKSSSRENLFLLFITLSQLVQMIPLGAGINSGLAIGERLGADRLESVWVVASYPLTQGTFVLIGGQLGAVFGHKATFTAGCAWWVVWALCGGFSDGLVSMCVMRALCGIGGGIMVPNIIALIGINFPPGPKRNLGFALFGAMAPVGAAGGSLVSAVIVQLSHWKWLFFMLGLLGSVIYGTTILVVAADEPVARDEPVDWVGAYLGVAGLVLFNFVWNQAPLVGWSTPYEIALLIVSAIHIAAFVYWESRVAKLPILPLDIWTSPSFGTLMVTIFFSFMSLGIYFWYMNSYMQTIRGDSLIRTGVQYLPLTIMGSIAPFLASWLVTKVPAQIIIALGCLAMVIITALLATIPADLTYWAMAFPAMFLSAFTIDLIITAAQIIASNTVSLKHQGVAGSLVGTLLSYGLSTGLGFAGTVEVNTFDGGKDLLRGYHSAAYLAVGFSGAALVLCAFIRIPKDERNGWGDEADVTE